MISDDIEGVRRMGHGNPRRVAKWGRILDRYESLIGDVKDDEEMMASEILLPHPGVPLAVQIHAVEAGVFQQGENGLRLESV